MIVSIILLAIGVLVCTYFIYKTRQEASNNFLILSELIKKETKTNGLEVIKSVEKVKVKVDNSDVIKTIEGGVNEILVKVDNSTKTVTDILENLTIEIQE